MMHVQGYTMQKPSLLAQVQISSTAHRGTVNQLANKMMFMLVLEDDRVCK